MLRTSIKFVTPLIILIIVLTVAFFVGQDSNNEVQGHTCTLLKGQCKLSFDNHYVDLKIGPTPLSIEEELKVVFSYSKNLKLKDTWVEGSNMFMGKMKVLTNTPNVQQLNTVTTGVLFLGSCNLNHMTWMLVAEFETSDSETGTRLEFNFATTIE